MEESENLNQEKNVTHQLHNFINPYDREGGYILFSGGIQKKKRSIGNTTLLFVI